VQPDHGQEYLNKKMEIMEWCLIIEVIKQTLVGPKFDVVSAGFEHQT
jgi:hypothetical protein